MSERDPAWDVIPEDETSAAAASRCPRLHRAVTLAEHIACPYCFGAEVDVSSGDLKRYCDFEEGRDPVCFGFPRA